MNYLQVGDDLEGRVHVTSVSQILKAHSGATGDLISLTIKRAGHRPVRRLAGRLPVFEALCGELIRAIAELCVNELSEPQPKLF